MSADDNYPCAQCAKPRTKAEGGTVFTVCDDCWPTGTPSIDSIAEPRPDDLKRCRECGVERFVSRVGIDRDAWNCAMWNLGEQKLRADRAEAEPTRLLSLVSQLTGERDEAVAEVERLRKVEKFLRYYECCDDAVSKMTEAVLKVVEDTPLEGDVENLVMNLDQFRKQRDEARSQVAELTASLARVTAERDDHKRELAEILDALLVGPLEAGTMQDTIVALRKGLDAALREADRLRHGTTIEGDFVCPNELDAANLRRVHDVARRVVSRGIHRRQCHREVMMRNVELLPNDIEILGKLAEAVSQSATDGEGKS